jgi:hypothetical protein
MFPRAIRSTQQQPGITEGYFTRAWITFWTRELNNNFDRVFADEVTRDAIRRIENGIEAVGRKPRNRRQSLSIRTIGNIGHKKAAIKEAQAAGKEQAISAIRYHQRSIKGIEKNRGRATQ